MYTYIYIYIYNIYICIYTHTHIQVIEGQAGSIPRADVADFCLGAALDADFPYIGKTPCISSVGGTGWTKDRSGTARGEMAN